MQFNSYLFLLLFLPLTLLGYFCLGKRMGRSGAMGWLTGASLVFFAWKMPLWHIGLLLGSALFNWHLSRLLVGKEGGIPGGNTKRKLLLAFGVGGNLALLFYFKYTGFFLENANRIFDREWTFYKILVPMGLSFFTFQQIAWLVDSYRLETRGYHFGEYLLFSVYFPKIAMGPILLHGELIPQLRDPSRIKADPEKISEGLMILAVGLFKKVILAEFFAGPVAWGFGSKEILGSSDAFFVMVSYGFQLYFDFSGYCDMAMGVSRMFGLELPLNFDSPYQALSPVEFWKRWHITLTRFLRKYLYFPLGGSKKGILRTYVNIMIVFLVSGLWHGAAWTFVLWGILHGLGQCLNRLFQKTWEGFHAAFQWMGTFLFVNLTWVVFRAESVSQAKDFLKGLLNYGKMQLNPAFLDSFQMVELPPFLTSHRLFTVFGIYGIAFFLVMNTNNMGRTKLRPTLFRGIGTALLLVWSILSLGGISGFIYFQF